MRTRVRVRGSHLSINAEQYDGFANMYCIYGTATCEIISPVNMALILECGCALYACERWGEHSAGKRAAATCPIWHGDPPKKTTPIAEYRKTIARCSMQSTMKSAPEEAARPPNQSLEAPLSFDTNIRITFSGVAHRFATRSLGECKGPCRMCSHNSV